MSQNSTAQLVFGGGEVVEDSVEDQVEEAVEEVITDSQTDDVVQDAIEDQIVEETESRLVFGGGAIVDDVVEEQVEDQAEAQLEDDITEDTEAAVEDDIVSAAEEEVVEATEQQLVDTAEEAVEDSLDEEVDAAVEDSIVDSTEAQVEETVADAASEKIEETVADQTEQTVIENAEQAVADSVTDAAEVQVAEATQSAVEDQVVEQSEAVVADAVEDSAEVVVALAVEASTEAAVESQAEEAAQEAAQLAAAESVELRMEAEIDEMLDTLESDIELDDERISRGQWLVMAEPQVFDELASEGYLFDAFTELPSLGLRLAEVAAPASFDISAARDGIMDVVGSDRAEVDLNHIYTAGTPETVAFEQGVAPLEALQFPVDTRDANVKIGIIDSAIDPEHSAFAQASIKRQAFTAAGARQPDFHGTAIASILASRDARLPGLVPLAQLYAASVFEEDEQKGEIASTVNLVKALDWLLASGVDTINLSLAGPPNRLLEVALRQVTSQGVVVLAAAGNGGPLARPKYPAAYDSVVAVTAVDMNGKVFRLANRGDYLDIAAPGVNVRHAVPGGGFAASSGTSFAVPFATVAAARLKQRDPALDVVASLYASTVDIGPPGRDEIYGYGLLKP